jgi:hypothetical protein
MRGMRGMGGAMRGMRGMGGGMGGAMAGKKGTPPIIFALMMLCGCLIGCSSMAAMCKFGVMNKKKR